MSNLFYLLLIAIVSATLGTVGFAFIILFLIIALAFFKSRTGLNSIPDIAVILSFIVLSLIIIRANMGMIRSLKSIERKFSSSLLGLKTPEEARYLTLAKITLINIPVAETAIKAAITTNDLLWFRSVSLLPVVILLLAIITYQTFTLKPEREM